MRETSLTADRNIRALIALLAFAFMLRIAAVFAFPSLHHPDENFQFFEQSHRLAFGYGIVPWEFRDGIRSLLLPRAFAGVFLIANRLIGGPQGYIAAARIALAMFSLISVAAMYCLGMQRSRTHALLAGLVAASWFELVYFSSRPLTEAIAMSFLLLALSLASQIDTPFSVRRLFAIGFSLGCCLMLRIHLAAGVCVVSWWILRGDFRGRWGWLFIGFVPPLIAFGVSDWVDWGTPFHSQLAAVRINLLEHKASGYGIEGLGWYWYCLGSTWGGALPVLLALMALGWNKYKLWLITAFAIIASHSLIPHKEYRFVAPAFACLVLVAALSSADILEWIRPNLRQRHFTLLATVVAVLWMTTSWALGAGPAYVNNWTQGRGLIQSFTVLSAEPRLCGLLLYDFPWYATGGYAYLHRNIPIYNLGYGGEQATVVDRQAYNFVLLKRSSVDKFAPNFTQRRCVGNGGGDDVCVVARTGSCMPQSTVRPLLQISGLGE